MLRISAILLIFLLGSFTMTAQIEWVGNHEFSESATDLVQTAQNQYVLLHGNGITVFDSLGNIVFSDYLGSYQTSELVTTPDTSVLLIANIFGCDYFYAEIIKFDKNWNKEWKHVYTGEVTQVAYLSDDVIIYGHGDPYVERFDLGNKFLPIWKVNLGSGFNVQDICFSQEGDILVSTDSGLVVLDIDGNIDTVYQNLKFGRLELSSQGLYYAQTGNSLISFSAGFEPLDTFSTEPFQITDYATNNDFIWLITSEPRIIHLSNDLAEVATFPLNYQTISFAHILPFNDGTMVAGSEKYGEDNHSNNSAFVKSFGFDGNTLHTQNDVGIPSVTMDEPTVKYNGVSGLNVPYAITFNNLKIEVKNFGSTPVNHLNINVYFPPFYIPFGCPIYQEFSIPFNDLNLQPGGSTELAAGNLEIYFHEDPSGPLEFCMWTSLPDNHFDTNNNNDVACTEVLVSTSEPTSILFNTTFFPESDELQIHFASESIGNLLDLKLFDVSGQLVVSERLFTNERLSMAHLPDGLYLAHVSFPDRKGSDKSGWGKVLKY